MNITVREYKSTDAHAAAEIWNEVVRDGVAFPQENEMSDAGADDFFRSQSYTGIACDENGRVYGLYILHPNNVGRCGHISNASYAVSSSARRKGVGRAVVTDCIKKARSSASEFYSSMRWWQATLRHWHCISRSDLNSSVLFRADSG